MANAYMGKDAPGLEKIRANVPAKDRTLKAVKVDSLPNRKVIPSASSKFGRPNETVCGAKLGLYGARNFFLLKWHQV